MIRVHEDFLPDPMGYRERALSQRFHIVHDGPVVFQGIQPCADPTLPMKLVETYPALRPTMSFFRLSPEGQTEPMMLHTDASMGDWTALLYLNTHPPEGDGTTFYVHKETGACASADDSEAADWFNLEKWERRGFIAAKFNRLVMFSSHLFHSRALPENYGEGLDGRLIQVCFGTGELT